MKVGSIIEPRERSVPGEIHLEEPGYDFKNIIHVGDERKFADFGVDYVIFHKQPANPWPGTVADLAFWMERYRKRYGDPSYEDSEMVVYKIKKA